MTSTNADPSATESPGTLDCLLAKAAKWDRVAEAWADFHDNGGGSWSEWGVISYELMQDMDNEPAAERGPVAHPLYPRTVNGGSSWP